MKEALIGVLISAHAAMVERYGSDAIDLKMIALIVAIAEVESAGDARAIGDGGMAVGVLQIHPIMVQDVNRIQRLNNRRDEYANSDRLSVRRSIEMFLIYVDHYERSNRFCSTTIARKWNGGPNGHRKVSTIDYAEKVDQAYERFLPMVHELSTAEVK